MTVLPGKASMPRNTLTGRDAADVSDSELVDLMVAARRSAARWQAMELAAVAELAARRRAEEQVAHVGVISAGDYLNDEVASALRLTATSADELIRFATELTGRLPATFAALAGGEIDYARARTVWHGTTQVGDEVTAEIERRVLARAPEQTTGEIRAKIRRLVRRLDADALTRRRERAQRQRDVQVIATDDGTAHLTGLDLPAHAATAAHNRLNAIATGIKTDGDRRAIGQLRADVFLALLCGTLTTTAPPTDPSVPQETDTPDRHEDGWNGIDDAIADGIAQITRTHLTQLTKPTGRTGETPGQDPPEEANRPGELRTGAVKTPLFADAAQARLAGDATERQPPTEPAPAQVEGLHGHRLPERHQDIVELLSQAGERITRALTELKLSWCIPPQGDYGDGTPPRPHGHYGYRVPVRMRRLLEHRDRRCCFVGCRRPVRHCDADHTIPHHRGGPTCACNLAMLCRHHHALKQTRGWRLEQLWPGVLLWITPTGHWRITAPADRE